VSDLQCAARIFLARHAEAEYEEETLVEQGGSLTAAGRTQARRLGERLSGQRVALVYSSTVSRAVQTAELAAGVLGAGVVVREGLAEFGPGEHRGAPAGQGLFDPVMEKWLAGDLDARVPGGESGREIAARVTGVLEDVSDRHRGESVLVVGHGGALVATLAALAPGALTDLAIDNCETFLLELDADGTRVSPGPAETPIR
jgi:2,3-bisphosphoglycerate-dependent phosphoglycerate mutase